MVVGADKTGVGTTDGVIGGGTRCVGTGALLVTNGGLLSRSIRLDDSVDEDADKYCISLESLFKCDVIVLHLRLDLVHMLHHGPIFIDGWWDQMVVIWVRLVCTRVLVWSDC